MKAIPFKVVDGVRINCSPDEATYIEIKRPGPAGLIALPVTPPTGWTWNKSVDAPTIQPSILTTGTHYQGGDPVDKANWPDIRCHTFITDGKVQFLADCSHELKGQTLDLIDL
jgi:hypothetical protein